MLRRSPARLGVALIAVLLGVALVQTLRYGRVSDPAPPPSGVTAPLGAAARLAGALRFPTISTEDPGAFDAGPFTALHDYLAVTFPNAHTRLQREVLGGHSLLFTWRGTDPSQAAMLLAAHMDVVPVEDASAAEWQHEPFSGAIADGMVWGRGAIDNKSAVIGILEAVERLLAGGFQPERTIYLAFGHDEEVGGTAGARVIASALRARGVRIGFALDEGGVIGDGLIANVRRPVALVGVAEKGFASVELTVQAGGGHSSLPPRETAIGILSAAIARLEGRQMAARFEGVTRQMFHSLGGEFPLLQRVVLANTWLTRPWLLRRLEATPATNAMVRTTTAPTIFHAGSKDNVLPSGARAVVNFRILPGDSVAAVLRHVRGVVDDDRVAIRLAGRFSAEPSTPTPIESPEYRELSRAVRSVVPEAIVAPYTVAVVTDARYYADLGTHLFRLLPLRLSAGDVGRIHGANERIGIAEYEDAVRIYHELLVGVAGRVPTGPRGN